MKEPPSTEPRPEEPPPRVSSPPEPEAVPLVPELLISDLLRHGVVASLSLVTLGTVVTFFRHPDYLVSSEALERLTAPHPVPHGLAEVVAGALAARGQSFVMAGLLVMMAVPVMRVALSLLIFRQQKDKLFVAITTAVLVLLLVSFLVGAAEG
ncbi:hypothetical protein MYSTI_05239 [Myxococcus stipitatus DSM 14675]|uniref:DUF1634 domain-containing protein n=1 Tax=Myxococcus stipitatus (strain DSM 14675 / JCM 12634 / Mx s8) TaxID=1278073 RepID=L7UF84_MYXSD|nr:DUF1634 domain-containing protein [Myxococcus stipitatus]AGC46520.1 hypothetical protein MYSTI_05239 [Myxococcus stipitatus DSM 14675]